MTFASQFHVYLSWVEVSSMWKLSTNVIVKYSQTFVWSSSDKKGCSLRTTLSLSTSWIVARHIPLRRGGQCGATPAATKWSHSLWGATSHAPGHSQPVRSYLVHWYIFGCLVVFVVSCVAFASFKPSKSYLVLVIWENGHKFIMFHKPKHLLKKNLTN